MNPPERLELCGITSASQSGTFAWHSRSSASHRSSGVCASTELAGSAGTAALRKITLRWRLFAVPTLFVHS